MVERTAVFVVFREPRPAFLGELHRQLVVLGRVRPEPV